MCAGSMFIEMAEHFVSTGEAPNTEYVIDGLRDFRAISIGGRALLLVKGPEVHVFIPAAWRGRAFSRRVVRTMLQPLIEHYGYVTTRLALDEQPGRIDLVTRLGFKPSWSDGVRQYYLLTELPFPKRTAS